MEPHMFFSVRVIITVLAKTILAPKAVSSWWGPGQAVRSQQWERPVLCLQAQPEPGARSFQGVHIVV